MPILAWRRPCGRIVRLPDAEPYTTQAKRRGWELAEVDGGLRGTPGLGQRLLNAGPDCEVPHRQDQQQQNDFAPISLHTHNIG